MKTSSLLLATLVAFSALSFSTTSFAQETTSANKFTDESELALVSVSGNSSSSNISAKQKNSYTFGKDTISAGGHYLRTESAGIETARSWDLQGRYEHVIHENLSGYVGYGADSDPFAGYIQRDNFDIGAKYQLVKTEWQNWSVELGYRYSKMNTTMDMQYANMGRGYTEYNVNFSKSFSARYWVEYLPNFSDSEAYFVNTEPSVSMLITQIFSLKMAYLIQYHNKLIQPTEVHTDTTFNTFLVEKF